MLQGLRPGGRRKVLRKIAARLRDKVKLRFTTQGDGSWAPPSRWITAKTGRRKALIPLRDRIKSRLVNDNEAQVYFDAPTSEWSIEMHDRGFRSPPVVGKRMVIPLRNPAILEARGSRIVLRNRRTSVIPARRIWLTPAETRRVVSEELDAFARALEAS